MTLYRDRKTGQVFQSIEEAKANFCTGGPCSACPIGRANNKTVYTCDIYARTFPRTAALKMGLEVLDGPAPSASAKEPPTRRSILRDAEKCVVGDRDQDYGSPENLMIFPSQAEHARWHKLNDSGNQKGGDAV